MRISAAAAAECTERIAAMTRPARVIKCSAFVLVDVQIAAVNQFFYGCGRSTHPVGGEPDSAGSIPQRDADGVTAARSAVIGHIELQGAVARAGNGDRRSQIGDVLDAGLAVELRLAGRARSDTSA